MVDHNVFEHNEPKKASLMKEPYKAVLESKAAGVKIVVTAEANDEDGGQEEAERRARLVVEHFRILLHAI